MAREQRRLAAIVAADVVGYSRLMGRDEAGTLARLRDHRKQRFEPILARYGGRLVKLTGDGALTEFGSAVDALGAAIEFQQTMTEVNQDQPEETRIVFRIGLHLGDLIVDGEDLYGDGINVAARLEGEAPEGGIVISRTVHEAVEGRLKATFEDLGSLALKNIERSVQAFRVQWSPVDWQSSVALASAALSGVGPNADGPPPLPDKPSVAVLPFQNMSGDPEQEYFADGIVEDIITALSRNRTLFVIARNSTFAYKDKSPDVRQVGRDLGVRYVLEGSVRKGGVRLRITGQLIDAQTGAHIWADRFDGGLADIFDLQDQIVSQVVGMMSPMLEKAEIERSQRKPTSDLRAYDHYLRGLSGFYGFSKQQHEESLTHCLTATKLDPTFALSYAQAAMGYVERKAFAWSTDATADTCEGERLARRALELDRTDPRVLINAGYALAYLCGRVEEGAAFIDLGLELDPNHAAGWTWGGFAKLFLGDARSVDYFERSMRLSPRDPLIMLPLSGIGMVNYELGNYEAAAHWSEKAMREAPTYVLPIRTALAAYGMLRQSDKAQAAYANHRKLDPTARLSNMKDRLTHRRPEDIQKYIEGWRLAGMPE